MEVLHWGRLARNQNVRFKERLIIKRGTLLDPTLVDPRYFLMDMVTTIVAQMIYFIIVLFGNQIKKSWVYSLRVYPM